MNRLLAAAWRIAIALAVLSTAALAADDVTPKPTAPTTPPDLILNCHFIAHEFTVEVWNSGVVRAEGVVKSAQVTFASIDILRSRSRGQSGNFLEEHEIIDRVRGDVRFEIRDVDANGQLTHPTTLSNPPAGFQCEAAQRKF
jgi:hypothetical protein